MFLEKVKRNKETIAGYLFVAPLYSAFILFIPWLGL